ncbi:hypothetical protein [Flavobacterium anhuiense]|uniref:hypothetical protein n=1 Tax=Flavobacterium anhuiense TaxID=459526 RepID=UPI002025BCF2|nr:hypothetical protein [Flavobacterium anhuiense]URM35545.1 hypothetical protein LLY39_13940 [Flavobacterium anhuiense]
MKNFDKIKGLKVRGIIHNYNLKKLSISFYDTNESLIFYDCPVSFDTGIIGKEIRIVNEYSGEMSFVIVFREMKLNSEDYNYFIIKGEDGERHSQNQIRIAYKRIEFKELLF